jgi:thiol peroxidase
MASILLKGNKIETIGELPAIGSKMNNFTLTNTDLSDLTQNDYLGKFIIFNIFPSLDTAVCAMSVRRFNQEAAMLNNTVVLCVSADLPFAHKRFCETEGIKNVQSLSAFRNPAFGNDYGVTIVNGPLRGLLSRAIVIADQTGQVIYTEQVPEITTEPNYEKALHTIQSLLK